jgi:CRISPR-associated endonuclease/helicase Cas3
LFKNRVELDFSLLDIDVDSLEDILIDKINKFDNGSNNILIEFLTKKRAKNFYNRVCESDELNKTIYLLTGDDNAINRKEIINQVKTNQNILLIATQVIEAGVDIDMDIGFKDMSLLDAEEQFLGRINRSCKKIGLVFFFNTEDYKLIYKSDIRSNKEFTLKNDSIKQILLSKNFSVFYDLIFKVLNELLKDKYVLERCESINLINNN